MNMAARPTQEVDVYKGLMSFDENDSDIFFGRTRERDLIVANLMASRFTLLYGPSGVGKTSVLRAGAIHDLKRQMAKNTHDLGLPEFTVVWLNVWRADLHLALEMAVRESVSQAMGGDGGPVVGDDLVDRLRKWTERLNGEILLVCDQFEEYFLYHPVEEPGGFGDVLSQILSTPDLKVNVLISLREDAVAQMDRFKGKVPGLFSNYLRIDRLSDDAAALAITGPVERWNRLHPNSQMSIDDDLVTGVLEQVRANKLDIGLAGRGHLNPSHTAPIETPYLQLVMQRLWSDARNHGQSRMTSRQLDDLGSAAGIVRRHVKSVMELLRPRQRGLARAVFKHLVTPSGSKIAHTATDLGEYARRDPVHVAAMLQRLEQGDARLVRSVAAPEDPSIIRYEIYHDVLAAVILEWQQRTTSVRRWWSGAGVAAAVAAIVGVIVWGVVYITNRHAEVWSEINLAEEILERRDYAGAIESAVEAVPGPVDGLIRTDDQLRRTIAVLTDALANLRERYTLDLDAADRNTADFIDGGSMKVSPDGKWIVHVGLEGSNLADTGDYETSNAIVWNPETGANEPIDGLIEYARLGPVFSRDSSRLMTVSASFDNPGVTETLLDGSFDSTKWSAAEDYILWAGYSDEDQPLIITNSPDGVTRLINIRSTKDPIRISGADSGFALDAALTPDGQKAAILFEDGRIDFVPTDRPQSDDFEPIWPTIEPSEIWFSPSGKYLIVQGSTNENQGSSDLQNDTAFEIYRSTTGGLMRMQEAGGKRPLEVSKTGRGAGASDGDPLGQEYVVASILRFANEDERLLTYRQGGPAGLWKPDGSESWEQIFKSTPLLTAGSNVMDLGFSEAKQPFVIQKNGDDAVVRDVETGAVLASLRDYGSQVLSAVASPDGKQVVTTSGDRKVRVWTVAAGAELKKFANLSNNISSITAHFPSGGDLTTGKSAIAFENGKISIFDSATQDGVRHLEASGQGGPITAIEFSDDGEQLIWADEKHVHFWRYHDQEPQKVEYNAASDARIEVQAIHSLPGDQIILIESSTRKLFSVDFDDAVVAPLALEDNVLAIAKTTNGTIFSILEASRVDGSGQDNPKLAAFGRQQREITDEFFVYNQDGDIAHASISENGEVAVLASHRRAFVFLTNSSERILTIDSGEVPPDRSSDPCGQTVAKQNPDASIAIQGVVLSSDGRWVLIQLASGTSKLWAIDAENQSQKLVGQFRTDNRNAFRKAVFSADGNRLLVAADDLVCVWDIKTGTRLAQLVGSTDAAAMLSTSDDVSLILVPIEEGRDRTSLKLWSVPQSADDIFQEANDVLERLGVK